MDKTTTTLIIVIIILVGVLGLVGGFMLQGFSTKTNNSSVNLTNSSVNSTNNTTQTKNESSNSQSDYISEGEAINIAKSYLNINQPYTSRAIFYYAEDDKPALWKVFFYSSKNPDKCLGFANVNARTGDIV